jgi:hypothetical protein
MQILEKKYLIAAALVCALAAVSCSGGGGGGGNDSGEANAMSGTWEGTYSTSLMDTSALTMNVTQDNNEFSGTYATEDSGGAITGTISGNTIIFDLDPSADCPGDFDGSGALNGSTLVLTFSGANCLGSHRNGQANLTKK